MPERPPFIVNIADAPEEGEVSGRWGGFWRVLTPGEERYDGRLGVNLTRLPPGNASVPFHFHMREDEVFYVLAGRGVLRYGDELHAIGPGDCIRCLAGTQVAHQIANDGDEDLVYLAIGLNDPQEVCVYPDSGKVQVRGLRRIGTMTDAPYMAGEPELPRIFELLAARGRGG